MDDETTVHHADASGGRVIPLSPEELATITSQAPLTSENVEKLNEKLAEDPDLALRVAKSLVQDPANWGHLFTLDEGRQADLRVIPESRTDPFDGIIDKAQVYADGMQVTLQIMGLHDGEPTEEAERSNPWWAPDHFEISVSAHSDHQGEGVEVKATLTWDF